jgi:hypothetical protein
MRKARLLGWPLATAGVTKADSTIYYGARVLAWNALCSII